jgi:hypothetical protein
VAPGPAHTELLAIFDIRVRLCPRPLFDRVGATVLHKPFDLEDLLALVADVASRLQSG